MASSTIYTLAYSPLPPCILSVWLRRGPWCLDFSHLSGQSPISIPRHCANSISCGKPSSPITGTVKLLPPLFLFFFFNLFIYFWLCWVFVSVRGLSLVAASGGHSSSRCAGLSLSQPLLLRSTGSRRAGSVVVAHRPRCSAACGVFPDQGSNLCLLHWQADSQPLRHQGSPNFAIFKGNLYIYMYLVCNTVTNIHDFLFTFILLRGL